MDELRLCKIGVPEEMKNRLKDFKVQSNRKLQDIHHEAMVQFIEEIREDLEAQRRPNFFASHRGERINILLSDDVYDIITRIAEEYHVSLSSVVFTALVQYVKKKKIYEYH